MQTDESVSLTVKEESFLPKRWLQPRAGDAEAAEKRCKDAIHV